MDQTNAVAVKMNMKKGRSTERKREVHRQLLAVSKGEMTAAEMRQMQDADASRRRQYKAERQSRRAERQFERGLGMARRRNQRRANLDARKEINKESSILWLVVYPAEHGERDCSETSANNYSEEPLHIDAKDYEEEINAEAQEHLATQRLEASGH